MNTTRRSLLQGLAGFPLVGTATAAVAAAAGHATVVDLEARYSAAARRSLEASRACDAADERMPYLAPPEALFTRPADPLARCFTPETYIGGREWFGSDERINTLRAWTSGNMRSPIIAPALPRRAEVLAAYDAWQAARKAAEDAAGVTAADAEYQAAWAVEKAIRLEIIELRSDAPEALRLKLRVFMDSQACGDWREGVDAGVARGLKSENGPWEEAFAASIVRDLATAYMAGTT